MTETALIPNLPTHCLVCGTKLSNTIRFNYIYYRCPAYNTSYGYDLMIDYDLKHKNIICTKIQIDNLSIWSNYDYLENKTIIFILDHSLNTASEVTFSYINQIFSLFDIEQNRQLLKILLAFS